MTMIKLIIGLCLLLTLTHDESYGSVIKTGFRCETKRPHERDYEILSVQLVRDEGSDSSKADYVVDKMKENCILETVYLQESFATKIYKRLHEIVAEYRREFDKTKTQYEFFQKSLDNWFPELVEFHILFIKYMRVKSVHTESGFSNAVSSKKDYTKFCMKYLQQFSEENPQIFLKYKIDRIMQAYAISSPGDDQHLDKIIIQSSEANAASNVISVDNFYQITDISLAITDKIKTLPPAQNLVAPPASEFEVLKGNLNKWYPKTVEFNNLFVIYLQNQPNLSKQKLELLNKDRSYYDIFCATFMAEFEKQNAAEIDKALRIVVLEYIQTYFKQFGSSVDQICEKLKINHMQTYPNQPIGKYIYDKNMLSENVRPIIADLTFIQELNSLAKNLNIWYPQSFELNKAFINFLSTKKISAITIKQISTPDLFINSLKGQLAEFCSKYRREVTDDIIRMIKQILVTDYKNIATDHDRIIKEIMKTDLEDLSFLIDVVYNEVLLKTLLPKKIDELTNIKPQLQKIESQIKEWYPENAGDFNRRIIEIFISKKITIEIIRQIDSKDKMKEYLTNNLIEFNKEPKITQECNQKVEMIVGEKYPHLIDYKTEIWAAFFKQYANGPLNFIIDMDNLNTMTNSMEPIIREIGLQDLNKKLNVWYSVSPQMNQKFLEYLKIQNIPNNLIEQCKDVGSFQLVMTEYIKNFATNNQNEVNTLFIQAVEEYLKGRELKVAPAKIIDEIKNKHLTDKNFILSVIFNQINFGNQMSKIINQLEFENEKQNLLGKIVEWNKDKPRDQKVYETIVNIIIENGLPFNIGSNQELIQNLRKPGIKITEQQLALCKVEIDKIIDQQLMQKYPQHYSIIIHNVKNFFQTNDLYHPSYMYDIDSILKKLLSMDQSIESFVQSYEMLKNLENGLNGVFINNKEFVIMFMKYIRTNFNSNKNFMTIEELKAYVTNPKLVIAKDNKYFIEFQKQNLVEYQALLYSVVQKHLTSSPQPAGTAPNQCLDKLKTNNYIQNLPIECLTDEKILDKQIKGNLHEIKINECAPNAKDKITKFLNAEKLPMETVNYFNSNPCILDEICGQEKPLDDAAIKTVLLSYKEFATNQCVDKCPRSSFQIAFNELIEDITDKSYICTFEKMKRTGKFDKSFLFRIINQEKLKAELYQAQPQVAKTVACN